MFVLSFSLRNQENQKRFINITARNLQQETINTVIKKKNNTIKYLVTVKIIVKTVTVAVFLLASKSIKSRITRYQITFDPPFCTSHLQHNAYEFFSENCYACFKSLQQAFIMAASHIFCWFEAFFWCIISTLNYQLGQCWDQSD